MVSYLGRTLIAAVLGGAMGAVSLVTAYSWNPGLHFGMDAPLPGLFTGMHPIERDASGSFAWTSARVDVELNGLDRGLDWSCTLRARAIRPPGDPMPVVDIAVDGSRAASVTMTGEYADLVFDVPASSAPRTTLTWRVAPTFTPGTADKRILGIQVDSFGCRPRAMAWPAMRALGQAAAASAFLALMLVLAGYSLGGALLASLVLAMGAAALLTAGGAAHGEFSGTVLRLTVWLTMAATALTSGIERVRRQPLSTEARAVIAISAVSLLLKLIGLMHPAKPVIDAVFHAHRLDNVLGGVYFFTQPVGSVQMPYGIGFYVFTAPWAWLTADHVALVRVVAASADVLAGAILYPVVRHAWGDRRMAALAVLAFQLAPLPFAVLGNANLTNLFGQTAALVTMAAAVRWRLEPRRVGSLIAFAFILAWALCSHVSTVTILSATIAVLAVLYFWRGDVARRRAAASLVIASAVAVVFAWLAFYRHFSDVFVAAFTGMFAGAGDAAAAGGVAVAVKGYMGPGERVVDLLRQAAASAGWPLLMLGSIGAWTIWRRGTRDRLVSALLAWAAVWAAFSASTVFAKVDAEYVRYAAEFLGRINLATLPMLAILAGVGAAAPWTDTFPPPARRATQVVVIALVGWAVLIAARTWLGWVR